MSAPSERPWTEDERYTLLTEILKNARVPSQQLFKIVREFNVTPNWSDIPLPSGRSLNSCQQAYSSMFHLPTQAQAHLPRPESYASASVPLLAPATPAVPAIGPSPERSIPAKRPYFHSEKPAFHRAIQPRPSSLGPTTMTLESGTPMSSAWPEPTTVNTDPPRKRGRPSKAEAERRKKAAEARGEEWPQHRRSKPKNPATLSGGAGAASERSIDSPQATNLRTPEMQKQDSGSSVATRGRGSTTTENTRRASRSSNVGEIDSVLGIVRSQPGQEKPLTSTESRTGSQDLPPVSLGGGIFPASRGSGSPFMSTSATDPDKRGPLVHANSPTISTGGRIPHSSAQSELPTPSVTRPEEART